MNSKKKILLDLCQKVGINVINDNNYIPLSDFISKILQIKGIINFIKNHDIQSTTINNIMCINFDQAIQLIEQSTRKIVKDIFKDILEEKSCESIGEIIPKKIEKNFLLFNGNKVHFIIDENENIWFRGIDVALLFGYKNPNDAINSHIREKYTKKLEKFSPSKTLGLNFQLTENDKRTIYINEPGFYEFAITSHMPIADPFKDWVCEEVLPTIRKKGMYKLEEKFSNVPVLTNYTNEIKLDYYENNIYISNIGILEIEENIGDKNQETFKFGETQDGVTRDNQHNRTFNKNYINICRKECYNRPIVENKFKKHLLKLGLLRKYNGQTEIFVLTSNIDEKVYKIEEIINLLDRLIIKYPLIAIKERDDKIKSLEEGNQLKLKEIEYKMTDNYKIELETANEHTKLEQEKEKTKQEQIKLEQEKTIHEIEKTKQMEIQKEQEKEKTKQMEIEYKCSPNYTLELEIKKMELLREQRNNNIINNQNKPIPVIVNNTYPFTYDNTYEDKLDTNPKLIGFNNGIYDLELMKFRPGKFDDYVSLTVGYDYIHENIAVELKNIIKQILPNKQFRKYLLTLLGSCLLGTNELQEFYCFNGKNNNEKFLLIEIIKFVFGQYCDTININSINENIINKKKIIFVQDERKVFSKTILEHNKLISLCSNCSTYKLILLYKTFPIIDFDNCSISYIWKQLKYVNFVSSNNSFNMNLLSELKLFKMDIINLFIKYYKKYKNRGLPDINTLNVKEIHELYMPYINKFIIEDPHKEIKNKYKDISEKNKYFIIWTQLKQDFNTWWIHTYHENPPIDSKLFFESYFNCKVCNIKINDVTHFGWKHFCIPHLQS